ncbi:MAG: hypothetical protein YFSK_4360 [Candidatus Yanofskyibacterium parasiticum]|nr:MAG: hypothetical protein YFSK_4360 [Candidatus Yanofskybacteria bacterium]
MKTNARILIGILIVSILSVILFLSFFQKSGAAEISLNRTEYDSSGTLEVAVKNDFGQEICFSSCYPYLAEIRDQNGEWKEYVYQDCPETARAVDCVPPRDLKKFRVALEDMPAGVHRLKVPFCLECAAGENFQPEQAVYSPVFEIK